MFDDFEEMEKEGRAITRFGLMQRLQDELVNVEKQLEEIEGTGKKRGKGLRRSGSDAVVGGERFSGNREEAHSQSVTSLPLYTRNKKPSKKR